MSGESLPLPPGMRDDKQAPGQRLGPLAFAARSSSWPPLARQRGFCSSSRPTFAGCARGHAGCQPKVRADCKARATQSSRRALFAAWLRCDWGRRWRAGWPAFSLSVLRPSAAAMQTSGVKRTALGRPGGCRVRGVDWLKVSEGGFGRSAVSASACLGRWLPARQRRCGSALQI
jgi:hypothetical protein